MKTEILGWVYTALVTASVLTAFPVAGAAQSNTALVTLDAGTVIPVRLNDPLGSATSMKGDGFTATLRSDDGSYYGRLPLGTQIEGIVRAVKPQHDREPGVIDLAFQRIRLPSGRSFPIEGSLIGLDNKSVIKTSDGRLIAKPDHKNQRLTYVGYGAGAGLIVGLLTKHPLENLALGGGLGYLFGALEKHHNDTPRDVSLSAGTELGVRLDQPVSVMSRVAYERDTASHYHMMNPGEGSHRLNDQDRYARRHETHAPASDDGGIGVLVGDQNVNFDSTVMPFVATTGVVMVPVTPVLQAANVRYKFNRERQALVVMPPDGSVRGYVGSRVAMVNGTQRVRLEAPIQRLNGVLYVPLRFLKLALHTDVTWDATSRTVIVANRRDGDVPNRP